MLNWAPRKGLLGQWGHLSWSEWQGFGDPCSVGPTERRGSLWEREGRVVEEGSCPPLS